MQLKDLPLSLDDQTSLEKSQELLVQISQRRSVRRFQKQNISIDIILNCLKIAHSAPSGANKKPWHFCLVQDPQIKKNIRIAAEKIETEFYQQKASQKWLDDLKPFKTDQHKPYLEEAPYLIPIFYKNYEMINGHKEQNYYAKESVGIATGFLISSLHQVGISTLTHTPAPIGFLNEVLNRPAHEKAFILLVVGLKHKDYQPPQIQNKKFSEVMTNY